MADKIDEKTIYDINQIVKTKPYVYRFEDGHFVTNDGQSDLEVVHATFRLSDPTSGAAGMAVDDGKALYTFLNAVKKDKDSELILTPKGFTKGEESFAVRFVDELPEHVIPDEEESGYEILDCRDASIFYERELLKQGGVTIGDVLDVLDFKRKNVENEFVFMEMIDDQIMLFEDKTSLALEGKVLISINNFHRLKTKKRDTKEFFHLCTGPNRLYVHYGNSEIDLVYKFMMLDVGRRR